MILCPKQDCILAWELLLVCGASMFLVACGGGLEDFLRKLEAARRELELPELGATEAPGRQRRNVVKRPGVSYERGDDDALGLRGPGAGSDDADQESLQGFDEPSFPDNEASDEAAILRELEEINSGSDTVKRGSRTSKRNKRHRHWTARDYGRSFKEADMSQQLETPSEEQYGEESMSGNDFGSLESGRRTLRMRGLNTNTTAYGSQSQSLLDDMQHTRKNVLLQDRYSTAMGSYPRNMQSSILDTEMERPDSHEEISQQKSQRKTDNIQLSDISSQIGNEDDTFQGYSFRNLESELESDIVGNNRNGVPIRRDHKTSPHQRNSLVFRQQLGKAKNGIKSGYGATYSGKEVEVSQNGRIEKNNFGGRDTERKKLTGGKLESWNEQNNNDENSDANGGDRLISYTDRRPEVKAYRNNNERQTLVEQGPESKHERVISHDQNSKYRKHSHFRYSFTPVANYESKKQRKALRKAKEPFNREKYSMARQSHSGRSRSHTWAKQKHPLRHVVGKDLAAAVTKEKLILEDSPGNFDLFDMSHSSRQRSSAKSPKDDESFHFLWDSQFDNKHHNAPTNKTHKGSDEVHTLEETDIITNSSSTIHKTKENGENASHGPSEDPAMEGIHSGKTIVGVIEEVMRQVEKSKEVNKHLGPHLTRDHAAEAEVRKPDEAATECGGHPCPNALLSKLTNAVAEIVNSEVGAARCAPMPKRLRCFVTWLLQGATEQFRPKNPGYVDPKRLAFYAAYYEEPGVGPPLTSTEHPHQKGASEGAEGFPCGEHREKGPCAASQQVHEKEGGGGGEEEEEDNERERQIRLLKQLLKEYHTLSSREQTRLHSVHQYLEQQLAALHAAATPYPSAAFHPPHGIQAGAEEEGVAEELATRHPEGGSLMEPSPMEPSPMEPSPMEPSPLEKPPEPPLLESPMESEQASILSHEAGLEQQEPVVDQEVAPVMAEEFGAESGGGAAAEVAADAETLGEAAAEDKAAGEAAFEEEAAREAVAEAAVEATASHEEHQHEVEQLATQDALAQTVAPLENENELIEKDLEILGLGNSSNFGTKFNLAPLGHHRTEEHESEEEEEEEGGEGEPEERGRMQKRAAAATAAPAAAPASGAAPAAADARTQQSPRNATEATTKSAAPQHEEKSVSLQPTQAEHSLTDPEEREMLRPLLDNADAMQRRRR